jgi:hypothetical protein
MHVVSSYPAGQLVARLSRARVDRIDAASSQLFMLFILRMTAA